MRSLRCFAFGSAVALALWACAAASGTDQQPPHPSGPRTVDPETQPLPPEPKGKIPDPLSPAAPEPAAPSPSPAAPEPSAAAAPSTADAGAKVAAKPAPKPGAPAAPTPAAPAAPAADCGTKENPCPMQKFMRGTMTAASTPESLEAAFNRVAGMSPNGGWAWASIAKKGAELAKSGDVAGAKAQCKTCHDQHREAYKKQFRARKI